VRRAIRARPVLQPDDRASAALRSRGYFLQSWRARRAYRLTQEFKVQSSAGSNLFAAVTVHPGLSLNYLIFGHSLNARFGSLARPQKIRIRGLWRLKQRRVGDPPPTLKAGTKVEAFNFQVTIRKHFSATGKSLTEFRPVWVQKNEINHRGRTPA
jgi:hypothetical protein